MSVPADSGVPADPIEASKASAPLDLGTCMASVARRHVAIALVACATLLFEIGVTRLLSVVLWYHFAFLAISLALLGLGAPGVLYAFRRPGAHALRGSLVSAGVSLPATVILIIKIGANFQDRPLFWVLALLTPLLALGSAICLLLMSAPGRRIGAMYAADLVGATLGATAIIPLLHAIPTPFVIAGAGLLPLAALALLDARARLTAAVLAGSFLALAAWGRPFELTYTKEYRELDAPLAERWTPTARLAVFATPPFSHGKKATFGWGVGAKAPREYVEQYWLEQDGSAGTPITRLDRPIGEIQHLLYDVTSIGYQVGAPDRVCIVGTGGGRDILTALAAGATHIDAVEVNGATVALVSEHFGEFSGDIYHRPGVHAQIDEGRSFLTRASGDYDLIQISLTDSWAATAAGAYALSENNLYTTEAMRLYWNRLSSTGTLSISRWAMGARRMEIARLALLAVDALEREGVDDPTRHLAIVQAGAVATLLVSRDTFAEARLRELIEAAQTRGFDVTWPSRGPPIAIAAEVLTSGASAYESRGFDLSPPTDDRPFFFHTVPLFGGPDEAEIGRLSENEQAVLPLRRLLGWTSGLALVAFCAPLLGRSLRSGRDFWRGSGYFAAIGLAFMLIEMPLIQRFVLYLGHPSHAAAEILATLLVGAGLGSLLAGRLDVARIQRLGLLLPLCVVASSLALDPVFAATLGLPFAGRAAITFLLVFPAAFVMGFAFPVGMMRFDERHKPWFWAINGAFGVVASVFSLALAMELGFAAVQWLGVVAYLAAVLLLRGPSSKGGAG